MSTKTVDVVLWWLLIMLHIDLIGSLWPHSYTIVNVTHRGHDTRQSVSLLLRRKSTIPPSLVSFIIIICCYTVNQVQIFLKHREPVIVAEPISLNVKLCSHIHKWQVFSLWFSYTGLHNNGTNVEQCLKCFSVLAAINSGLCMPLKLL